MTPAAFRRLRTIQAHRLVLMMTDGALLAQLSAFDFRSEVDRKFAAVLPEALETYGKLTESQRKVARRMVTEALVNLAVEARRNEREEKKLGGGS